jgi:DNA-binding transcriptional regulator YiaG
MLRGEISPERARDVTCLRDDTFKHAELDPVTYHRKQDRAWKAQTEATKIRHELNLTQDASAELPGVSLATVRKWERGIIDPSGAAKTLLAVARIMSEVIRGGGGGREMMSSH